MSDSPRVHLQPLTLDNWEQCIALRVDESQQRFLRTNVNAIARAQFLPESCQRAVYDDAGRMIGYVLFARDLAGGQWRIYHVMIDAAFQGRGYGRQVMERVIAEIAAKPDGGEILIAYLIDNAVARRLYAQLGFVEQPGDGSGKVMALLNVRG